MESLTEYGDKIFFLTINQNKNFSKNNVRYLPINDYLETSRIDRIIRTGLFLAKHVTFFLPFCFIDFKKTFHICKIERAVYRILRENKIDIIHNHFFYPSGENVFFAAKKAKLPIISTIRGAEVCNFPELNYGSLRSKYYRKMLSKTIKQIARITCPNKKIVSDVNRLFKVDKKKLEYLPNGLEKKIFMRKKRRIQKTDRSKKKILSVGRLVKLKNHSLILKAMKKLQAYPVELVIVGIGEEYEALSDYIDFNKLKNVSLLDEMKKDELFNLIEGSSFLIHASLTEGMPNIILESLAMGVPVLASDIPAHRDIVIEGYNGFLFDPFNVQNLIQKIKLLLEGDLDQNTIQSNCRQTSKQYTLEKKIMRYREIYMAAQLEVKS